MRRCLFAVAILAALVGVLVAPSGAVVAERAPESAAGRVPPAPASLKVSRTTSGYLLGWSSVPGVAGYRVSRLTAARGVEASNGTYMVDPTKLRWVPLATVDASTHTFVVHDAYRPEETYDEQSPMYAVEALNGSGYGPRQAARAGCAGAYFVSVRGSGQNPHPGDDSGYANGMGSLGSRLYQDARTRLGLSTANFQANAVNYPAQSVTGRHLGHIEAYRASENIGWKHTATTVENIAGRCPAARIVVFGFSQGAQAAGDAFQFGLATAARSHVTSLVLFADATYNNTDPRIEHPIGRAISDGMVYPTRPYFTRDASKQALTDPRGQEFTAWQVASWCSSRDDVCSLDPTYHGTVFHGPQYRCYADYAAFRLGRLAASTRWQAEADYSLPACTALLD